MSPGFLVWSRGMAELHSTREERWFVVGLQTSVSFALVRLFIARHEDGNIHRQGEPRSGALERWEPQVEVWVPSGGT